MNGVTDRPDEDPELIPAVQRLLFDAEYHRTEVLVRGEVIPVLSPVEVLLVGLLLDGGELEALVLLPLLLNSGLLPLHLVSIYLVLLVEAIIVILQSLRGLLLVPD